MAEKKPTKNAERRFIDAGTGKAVSRKPKSSIDTAKAEAAKIEASGKTASKRALGYRLGAFALWLAAIAFEILVILRINGTLFIPGELMTHVVIGIILDLICVASGSFLWKRSNRIAPVSKKNKLKFFLWNQMGLFAVVAAFFPIFIFLIKEDKIDERVRKICAIIASIALVIAVGCSIDYTPVSSEDLSAAQANSALLGDGTVYWTRWGHSYHLNPDCHTLMRSSDIFTGTIEQAFEANRTDPCDFCAMEGGEDLIDKTYVSLTDLAAVGQYEDQIEAAPDVVDPEGDDIERIFEGLEAPVQ